ncbi:histidinol-phosphate transaminase [Hyalangium rubrum]|uniref:Histidinol-phosphate aminotransferase n=1 Tax=Hyalangium rubrum TaxID=3103134 RepID=A0ABU5H8V2_9BACT|nr:histidinol-phosphate transaminase [Hyalangium sp. s54d21]MDY7229552.1 histidinol-phosphate transaminase [Hyalangium sp. s54d21]
MMLARSGLLVEPAPSLEVIEPAELSSNENPLGPAPKAWRAILESMGRASRYPDRDCSFTEERISQYLDVDPGNIVLGAGAFGVLRLIADSFMKPGSEVVFADPSYPMYRYFTHRKGCTPVIVPLTPDYRHDLLAMADAVGQQTSVVFVCNPNNPTGRPVSHEELIEFMDTVPEHVLVVLDEAYFEYACGPDMPDGVDWVRAERNVLVLRSFSKAYGLAGLRVGYGVGPEWITSALRQVRDPFTVNCLAQLAASAALEDRAHLEAVRGLNEYVRDEMCAQLERLGLAYIPSVTNFVMIQCGGDDIAITEHLKDQGVRVRHGSEYGMPGWIRVSTGTLEQTHRFLEELASLITAQDQEQEQGPTEEPHEEDAHEQEPEQALLVSMGK